MIALIRAAEDTETARNGLIDTFGLTEIQAQAILELRLRALTGLARKEIKAEHDDLIERIAELRAILADEARLMALIREELIEIRTASTTPPHRDHRGRGEIDLEQLIAEEDMVISITARGYIKRLRWAHIAPRAGRDRRDGMDRRRATTSSTCSSPPPTTICCSSPPSARSTG